MHGCGSMPAPWPFSSVWSVCSSKAFFSRSLTSQLQFFLLQRVSAALGGGGGVLSGMCEAPGMTWMGLDGSVKRGEFQNCAAMFAPVYVTDLTVAD